MAKRHSTLIPAAGYIRMSTDQQDDSPARQRSDIQSLVKRSGCRINVWYEDHGITGTESAKRPEFQRLLADAKHGTFRAVLLSAQSRMSREDVFDVMLHWRLLRDAGVTIVTCQRGELRFDDLGGMLTAIVDQYGAHEESVKIAHRCLGGKKLAVLNGSKQGGIPFGEETTIPLTDEDIPTAGRWREVLRYVRERGDVVYVAALSGTGRAFAPTCLAKAVLVGKLANLGHQKGLRNSGVFSCSQNGRIASAH